MKMEIVCLFLGLAFAGLVLGDTTFFEGSFDEKYVVVGENNLNVNEVFCGNAVCDIGEDCSGCMRDCGVCREEASGGSTGVFLQDYFEKRICDLALEYNLDRNDVGNADFFLDKLNDGRSLKISREKFDYYVENFREKCGEEYFIVGGVVIDLDNVSSGNNPRLVRVTGDVVGVLSDVRGGVFGLVLILTGVLIYFFVRRKIK